MCNFPDLQEVGTSSESSRLIRLEEEFSLLKHKISLQDSKNEEYDKFVDFIKEFQIKETEFQSSQKREIEKLNGVVSRVQSKEETRDGEMNQLKERLKQVEIVMQEDHRQHHIVKRQNSVTKKPNNVTPLPCIPKNACAFDFKDNKSVHSASIDKITTMPPSSCKDLSTNGHTSNGIYLLYDSNVKKVSTAFCDFSINKSIPF